MLKTGLYATVILRYISIIVSTRVLLLFGIALEIYTEGRLDTRRLVLHRKWDKYKIHNNLAMWHKAVEKADSGKVERLKHALLFCNGY